MWVERAPGRRDGADVTGRLYRDKGALEGAPKRAGEALGRLGRARQQLLDLDRDLVAADDHRALGHRQVVGEDADLVFLGGVELDDGAAAQPQHLMDRHRGRAEHYRDVDRDIIECRQGAPALWLMLCSCILLASYG